jgi:hypothetical protein
MGTPSLDVFEDPADGRIFFWEWPEYSGLATITPTYTHACRHSGDIGLKLEYRFSEGQDSHCGWGVTWDETTAGHLDASSFHSLTFQVRLQSGSGTFDVGLEDSNHPEVKKEVRATDDFVEIQIPLSYYRDKGVKLADLQTMSFGVSSNQGSGAICIDALEFR